MIRPSVPLFRASKERSSLAVDRPGEAEVRCVIFLGTGDSFNGERAQASGCWSHASKPGMWRCRGPAEARHPCSQPDCCSCARDWA
jgi:hypothetical protein